MVMKFGLRVTITTLGISLNSFFFLVFNMPFILFYFLHLGILIFELIFKFKVLEFSIQGILNGGGQITQWSMAWDLGQF